MNSPDYDVDLVINVSRINDGRQVIDLNMASLKGFFGTPSSLGRRASGINKEFFTKHKANYSQELHDNAVLFAKFLRGYAPAGRKTIFSALKEFFDFQVNHRRLLRDSSSLSDYSLHLQSRVLSREISRQHATTRFNQANAYLMMTGEISAYYKYSFTGQRYRGSNTPYTINDLKLITISAVQIYKTCSEMIKRHIDKQSLNKRDFPLNDCIEILEINFKKQNVTFDYIQRNPLFWFMQSAYILFVLYTWSNEKQLCELDANDITKNVDGVESNYLYKGRAKKFIRLNIGVSGLEADISGINFFEDYISTRQLILEYLFNTGYVSSHNALLFSPQRQTKEVRRFTPDTTRFSVHPIVISASQRDIEIPCISSRRIRKTVEQMTDNEIKDPFVILEKAQHNWGTYRKHYAHGNVLEARNAISTALKQLTDLCIQQEKFESRQEIAKQYDINLIEKQANDYQLNGLVCLDKKNTGENAKGFIRKQNHFGRKPKVCADFANCVNCPKCAVIDDEQAVYHLLSFQHMIEFNKSTFVGSSTAKNKHMHLVDKINLMLRFISPKTLARARNQLQNNGVADIWIT
ncbi:hypothetical protein A1QO_08855 [Vibrio genomosp. F10 str. ZF-129]|uniref:Uncharacterized protein n=1 Tax=Vibrio genomosp. F10 str. ZF-129 TaxID=1187848 RepID=A0A1E5BEI3_9VIBR|nr:hypothetical protein [Vibrio genomosp. F10]OEE33944.1 hypothetical protein A1QO_08855 [Vibrio genomosp. F10 str. ZF-129]